jgi:glycosyltransferase involved in cell wall biosynthesis
MNLMKIIFLVDRYPPQIHSGIGTFVQAIARGLGHRGHNVTVVDIGKKESEHYDEGIHVITLRESRLWKVGNLITRLRLRKWLVPRIEAGEIDIIELADYPGFLPVPIRGCPTVVRLHQSDAVWTVLSGGKPTWGVWLYEKRNLSVNTNWIGVSGHIVDLTQKIFGVFPKRSVVIYNPVSPLPSHMPDAPELPANFVLFAGQVARRKGAAVLAEAAREFLPSRPDLHLIFAGGIRNDGSRPFKEELLEIVGPDLAPRVQFLGQLEHVKVLACMKRAKVFAFPALWDNFPMAVLEAMSCGVPVVFTKRPPGPEMIEDGVTGLLVDPTSPKDLSEKIGRLLDDPALACRLAGNARKSVAQRFSMETCLTATEQFYEECRTS